MKKIDIIYREIADNALEGSVNFTQLSLAKTFGFSLSTVHHALSLLEEIGAIEKKNRGFRVINLKKLLLFWATRRNLERDIIYKTRVNLPVLKIESALPPSCVFTAYTGYKMLFDDVPADYSEVYAYSDGKTLEEIKVRFPIKKGPANLIILKGDAFLLKKGKPSKSQVFVDLWNLKEWYAEDFINAFIEKVSI